MLVTSHSGVGNTNLGILLSGSPILTKVKAPGGGPTCFRGYAPIGIESHVGLVEERAGLDWPVRKKSGVP